MVTAAIDRGAGMPKVFEKDGYIRMKMGNGTAIRFPVAENPRLARGNPHQLNHIEVSPFGLHWPDLDEDLSVLGILEGRFGVP
jgi:hypothetical protein